MSQILEATDPPFRLHAPIEHITELGDGTLVLHTVVTSETPDIHAGVTRDGVRYAGEIVDYDAFKEAAPELMKWANLQEMHDEGTAAGTILKLYFDDETRRVEADLHVVDPIAVKKVLSKTYKAVSIHGVRLRTAIERRGSQLYRRVTKLLADEISLVNRPANADSVFAKQYVLAKRAGGTEMTDAAAFDGAEEAGTAGSPIPDDTRTPGQRAIDETRAELAKAAGSSDDAEVDPDASADSDSSAQDQEEETVTDAAEGGEDEMAKDATTEGITTETGLVADPLDEVPDAVAAVAFVAEAAAEAVTDAVVADELADADEAVAPGDDAALAKAAGITPALAELLQEFLEERRAAPQPVAPASIAETPDVLAKAGARNAGADQARIDAIHDLTVALGATDHGARPAADAPGGDTLAKAATAAAPDPLDLIREALAPLVPSSKLEAIEARLTAIDERSVAQGETLAKIARSPSGGGPANSFAPVFRGGAPGGVTDKGSALEAAAQVIDDPRLRSAVGEAAALELIRTSRGAASS